MFLPQVLELMKYIQTTSLYVGWSQVVARNKKLEA